MKDVFIVEGLRTPIGSAGKSLKDVSPVTLGVIVLKALLKNNTEYGSLVDEVILGNAVGAGLGQNPARQVLVNAGLPVETPAFTVNKVCGSGLKSVTLAAQSILCGDSNAVIAGGIESASQNPRLLSRNIKAEGMDPGDMQDSLITDGLWCNLKNTHIGMIAEYTAEKFKISREAQDNYAFQSHKKAVCAQENGSFQREIAPVEIAGSVILDYDERPRKDISMERLSRLKPAFKPEGTVTAGNSPAPADGAAALILASEQAVKKFNFVPAARILGYASVAVSPELTFTAAALAIKKCLKASSLTIQDIDLFEIAESFAVQALLTIKEIGFDAKRLNVFGGTIALGHPLGASGARSLVTLINALKIEQKKTGIISICLGGGCAVSLAVRVLY